MRRGSRRGVATTMASVVLCSLFVLIVSTIYSYANNSATSAHLVELETRERTQAPILEAAMSLQLLSEFHQSVTKSPPNNCSSSSLVDEYLRGIKVSNASTTYVDGIQWIVNGTGRWTGNMNTSSMAVGDALLGQNSGANNGTININTTITINANNPGVSYHANNTDIVHLQEQLSSLCVSQALNGGSLGLVVPLYADPAISLQWSDLIIAKMANPYVPVVAIINPDNGPGNEPNADFQIGVKALHQVGIAVLGYEDTAYGYTPLSSISNETRDYLHWYGIDGVFFDDMNTSLLTYYDNATKIVNDIGVNYTMDNPGSFVNISPGISDSIVQYEQVGIPRNLQRMTNTVGTIIAYNVPSSPPSSWFKEIYSQGVGWVLITDRSNNYDDLPSYLNNEMQELGGLAS